MNSRRVRKVKPKHTFMQLSKPKSLVQYRKSIMHRIRCTLYKFINDFWLDPKVTKGQDLKLFLYFSHPRNYYEIQALNLRLKLLSFQKELTTCLSETVIVQGFLARSHGQLLRWENYEKKFNVNK